VAHLSRGVESASRLRENVHGAADANHPTRPPRQRTRMPSWSPSDSQKIAVWDVVVPTMFATELAPAAGFPQPNVWLDVYGDVPRHPAAIGWVALVSRDLRLRRLVPSRVAVVNRHGHASKSNGSSTRTGTVTGLNLVVTGCRHRLGVTTSVAVARPDAADPDFVVTEYTRVFVSRCQSQVATCDGVAPTTKTLAASAPPRPGRVLTKLFDELLDRCGGSLSPRQPRIPRIARPTRNVANSLGGRTHCRAPFHWVDRREWLPDAWVPLVTQIHPRFRQETPTCSR